MSPRRRPPLLLLAAVALACACAAARPCAALVRLGAASFVDAPARFGPRVTGDGICGSLRAADPADACAPVRAAPGGSGGMAFVLIARGNCSFEGKVRAAQRAGFDAALVHDDEDKASLYSMVGDPEGIHIPAVFVSKMAGETLKKFARGEDGECCINSSMDETAGTVLVMSFVSLVVIISVVASFLFARNCRLLRHGVDNRPPYIKKHVVEKLPSVVYKAPCSSGNNCEEACAICLEDYDNGDMLRLLPCKHEFHVECIDPWLTKWGTFCPVCKLEVLTGE
ncbi:unnamed protein product [Triticum aestivum]|uniref:RING-type E3 ubiquitin transferase n=4 Tax=Triticinae TaxID=1648030 RepID=A0A9R1EMX1_WHEAT|nr:receptor homology region, transmembrane domain- and RING domain-containing protein 1 [Aegilops tauschii subsp. strangulata]XP_044330016.1 receptor homology region, transmembrane domain- and RING domain-containing protein 1-like [Triticum aestivum]KAF7013542.1 hypothetical protein CFC21_027620 [Triticum aestivum]SPT15932.1 unnamed protein product [Triticum aestivum]